MSSEQQYELMEQYEQHLRILDEAIRRMERPEVEVPHEVFVERFREEGHGNV